MKRTASLLLAMFMAAPPMDVVSAPELGTIKGAVTVSSRPIRGVSLAFVDLASGNICRAPSMIAVAAGQIATADVDLAPIPGATMASASAQEPPAPAGGQLPSLPG